MTMKSTMTPDELRAIRQRHQLSQDELAELVGVTTPAVSKWERGERQIPLWFVKLHGYALVARAPDARARLGRPPTAKQEKQARIEREFPILCTMWLADPDEREPLGPITFRPYESTDGGPYRPMPRHEWNLVLQGGSHDELCGLVGGRQAAQRWLPRNGAQYSWRNVETTRPECVVTPAGFQNGA